MNPPLSTLDHRAQSLLNVDHYLHWILFSGVVNRATLETGVLFLPILANTFDTGVLPSGLPPAFCALARASLPAVHLAIPPPSPPYICQPKLFNQQTSVQVPAFGYPHSPHISPDPHIFATIPFLSARQASLYPRHIFTLTPVYLLIVHCNGMVFSWSVDSFR